MDYSKFNKTIARKLLAALAIINNPEIAPAIRQINQEILFKEVGDAVYAKVYDMNAFDFQIQHTTGPGMDNRHFGLAKKASASVSAGVLGMDEYVNNFLDSAASKAQGDAFNTARESRQFPRVTRRTVGETCKWCQSLAGTYTNPPSDVFARHGGCDCEIRTEGFKSRNGLLNNYVKPQDR